MSSSNNIEQVFDNFAKELKKMMANEFEWYNQSVEHKLDAFVAEFKTTLPKKRQSEYHIFIKNKIAEYKSQGLTGNLLEKAREEWKACQAEKKAQSNSHKKENTKSHKNDPIQNLIKRIMNAKSDYEILGIPTKINALEVKKIFKMLSLQVHPDKCKHPSATQAFQKINIAYHNIMNMF